MPGTYSPPPRVSDPHMHHDTSVAHVPWCMPGSLTSGFLWSRWRGKRSRSKFNLQFYLSGKRPMEVQTQWVQWSVSSTCMNALIGTRKYVNGCQYVWWCKNAYHRIALQDTSVTVQDSAFANCDLFSITVQWMTNNTEFRWNYFKRCLYVYVYIYEVPSLELYFIPYILI